MSNFTRVAWNPKERVARAAAYLDDYFGKHQYGVRFDGDAHVYRQDEAEIPVNLVLAPRDDMRAMVRDLADWDRQCFPLGGGDMIRLMVRFGVVTMADAECFYREAMAEHGEAIEWPPAHNADASGDTIPF